MLKKYAKRTNRSRRNPPRQEGEGSVVSSGPVPAVQLMLPVPEILAGLHSADVLLLALPALIPAWGAWALFEWVRDARAQESFDPFDARVPVWIDRHGRSYESYRFDVVGVLVEQERVRIRHVENAFEVRVSR